MEKARAVYDMSREGALELELVEERMAKMEIMLQQEKQKVQIAEAEASTYKHEIEQMKKKHYNCTD